MLLLRKFGQKKKPLPLVEKCLFKTKMFLTTHRLQLRCNWYFLIKKNNNGNSHLSQPIYVIGK
jgi:hypothetical protein